MRELYWPSDLNLTLPKQKYTVSSLYQSDQCLSVLPAKRKNSLFRASSNVIETFRSNSNPTPILSSREVHHLQSEQGSKTMPSTCARDSDYRMKIYMLFSHSIRKCLKICHGCFPPTTANTWTTWCRVFLEKLTATQQAQNSLLTGTKRHKSQSPGAIINHFNQVHKFASHFLKTHFSITSHYIYVLTFPKLTTHLAHSSFLDLTILIMLGEEYKLFNSSLRMLWFLSYFIISRNKQHIQHSFSNTISIYFPPKWQETRFHAYLKHAELYFWVFSSLCSWIEDRKIWF
jgi:hypothetical protein